MITAGLDLSYTGTGVTVIDDAGNVILRSLICTEPADGTDIERCIHISTEVGVLLMATHADIVGIEGYAMGKEFGREKAGELGGIVKCKVHNLGLPYDVIPPRSLQLFALGHAYRSAEGKERMIAAAREHGCNTYDDNVADAYWIARWRRSGLTVAQINAEAKQSK